MTRDETRAARARYNRIAPIYDLMERLPERTFRAWRERAWLLATGPEALELGVGTGKNMPYYPEGVRVTGVDLSEKMLQRARQRADALGAQVTLRLMDGQALEFDDDTLDGAVATFVLCSVPEPLLALRELNRVVEPGGRIVLLKHVRPRDAVLGRLFDLLDPIVVRLMGPHINRRTVDNVRRAGLTLEAVHDLSSNGIFKLIVARAAG